MKYSQRKFHEGAGGDSTCRSCGAPIRWLLTPRGRVMPTDADTVKLTDTAFDSKRHRSHFATCRQADLWRRPEV